MKTKTVAIGDLVWDKNEGVGIIIPYPKINKRRSVKLLCVRWFKSRRINFRYNWEKIL